MEKLLSQFGDPQNNLPPTIHIAGTNGKGSTTAFCRAILEAAGKKVHVYSSPHLVNWRERIRIAGKLIEDQKLSEMIAFIANIADPDVTIFEMLTACAFLTFSENKADAAIFEVGLGGKLDASNVIKSPTCSVITPISLDHCKILGSNLSAIAQEKAGIIKQNCPLVLSTQPQEAMEVFTQIAQEKQSQIFALGSDFNFELKEGNIRWYNQTDCYNLPFPKLKGTHQLDNAATAIQATKIMFADINERMIGHALQNVDWPARLQNIKSGTIWKALQGKGLDIWLDGAHNEAGAESCANFIKSLEKRVVMVTAMLNTKDIAAFLSKFKFVDKCYTVAISDTENCVVPSLLQQKALKFGINDCTNANSLANAINIISTQQHTEPTIILIAGSLHLAGEFLKLNNTIPN